ncbi:MAG: hypothetical protein WCB86_08590 [Candidatus Dormiibacterota bacterium]
MVLSASLLMVACGSTPAVQSSPTPSRSSSGQAAPTPTPTQAAVVTINTASVSGLGTVLVNSHGRTLYTLSSEGAGKLTCTVANGCTQSWFESDLPPDTAAATAAGGVQTSLLGTEAGAAGTVVTYDGWPLYTFSGDGAANQANGEGLQSFGGTWYALEASGALVKPGSADSSPSPSSGADGY